MQVARSLGKTFRAFQPTIKELQVLMYKAFGFDFGFVVIIYVFLRRPWELSTFQFFVIYMFQSRKFLGNSRALLKRRLVWMKFQVQAQE